MLNFQSTNYFINYDFSYFVKKISDFDMRMKLYKQELEAFEESLTSENAAPMTPRGMDVI